MHKIYTDPEIGEVKLRKNIRCRRISLRVSPCGGVTVSLPWICSYSTAIAFIEANKAWVLKTMEKQKAKIGAEAEVSREEIEALRKRAKAELPVRLAELAEEYSFRYNQVRIKHNSSNWGSCSRKGNINLNLNLVRLPDELRDYVLLHELCHLRIPDHSPKFHALLESLCPEHRRKQKALKEYKLF